MLREILHEQIAIAPCRCLNPIVRGAIEALRDDPFVGKELKLELSGYRSLPARRYCVIYRLDEVARSVEIHHFGPRIDVYESFRRLLQAELQR